VPDILKIMITPVALIFGALIGTWRFQLDLRRDVGFRGATATHAVVFTLGFLVLMGLHEWLYHLAGMADGQNDWRKYAPGALALRVLFVGLVYPFAEELFFRGFLLGLITRKAGAFAGIVVTTLLFTSLHGMAAVSWVGPLLLFTDGAYFAFARLRSGSLLLPLAFHILGNSVAIVQRLY
jgi:membrane protease YdiL (CAAX protease family)